MTKHFCFSFFALCIFIFGPSGQEARPLEPGKPVEREIVGGESHAYQIELAAGQFARFQLQQRAIDSVLILTAPDGKQLAEVNLTRLNRLGEQESLSLQAPVTGSYRLTVRGAEAAVVRGSYRLEVVVRAEATAQDRQRMKAEALLVEANELSQQAGRTAQQVIEKAQQALPLWRELGEPHWTAYALTLIGAAYLDLNQFGKALEPFEQALAIWREVKDRAGEGSALNYVGRATGGLGRPEKAIGYYEQAMAIWRELQYRRSVGIAFNNLGTANRNLNRPEKAIEYYEQALGIAREVKDRAEEGMALLNLGLVNNRLGRTEKAIEYYEQALAIVREAKDRQAEANSLTQLAIFHNLLYHYEKAIEYFEQALPIQRELRNRQGEARALNNLGDAYSRLGRYEKAIEYHEQALALHREVRYRQGEAGALNFLGNAYLNLSRPEKAIEYYEQSLALAREMKERAQEGNALNNLGICYVNLGRSEEAIKYYEQALAIKREVKNRRDEGNALNELGNAFFSMGRAEKAIEYYEQALAIAREWKDQGLEETCLQSLGYANLGLGRNEKAIVYLEQGLLIARELKLPVREAPVLYTLAAAEASRGNLARARTLIEGSLQISESLRTEVISKESRASLLSGFQSDYQLYTDLLMRQHKSEPTKGFDALAVETSERQRARSLLDQLTEARVDIRQGVDAALLERERLLGRQLNAKAQLLTEANRPEQAAALRREISQLETDYERAQAAIRNASPHYAALTQPQPLKLKEIQAQLDADTLLLEYALGEERSYLWAITKDSLTSYELPKEEQIKREALQVIGLLTARTTSQRGELPAERRARIAQAEARLPAAAQTLSQTVLGPVAPQIGNKRLVIVADGALQYIPFAMLPVPKDEGGRMKDEKKNGVPIHPSSFIAHPLILDHEVVSLSSASALAIQRAELAERQPAPKLLAVIADPVFDRTDARLHAAAPAASDKTQPQTSAFDDARSIEHLAEKSDNASGATRRLVIPRLPFTRQEATQLLTLSPKASSFGALDFQARRATVLNGELSQYRYVHFATHGLLDAERPGLSSLVLSLVDEKGEAQEGFLRANDIYNLKLPAELVVLSACQTGLGKEIKGEGLVGLTRGFMYAGAARVVVSLWSVNDKATADLMTKFYEKMLKQGERPAAALRAAQVEMWKQKQWQAPFYWAAFVLQGEWK